MAHFLFIHGACHGAWCWQQVTSLLCQLGHECYSIDLPGHGNDQTPRARITRQDYLNAVSHAIEALEWENITLVGHSAAGILLADLSAKHAEIHRLIYLAAYIPNQNESMLDQLPPDRQIQYQTMASTSSTRCIALDFDTMYKYYFNNLSLTQAQFYYQKITPEPIGPYEEKVKMSPSQLSVKQDYIICKYDQRLLEEQAKRFASRTKGQIHTLDTDHCVMLSNPQLLSQTLHNIVTNATDT
ncbi:alpha/beta fold hydrolase [uncultured Shewanella sp.]|uniref:alpha/beta fold hydrolase n=1 Tax=uncultured Shewanella sp. TaxID=173975 RepID=UPI0026289F41|nr:alpha/beta fold hydrolase [uncultured Shewanella sp.]